MTTVRDYLPDRRTRSGEQVFQLHPLPDFTDMLPWSVYVSIDPPLWTITAAAGVCGGAGFPDDDSDLVSCERLVLHEGPHAGHSDEGALTTFTQCCCRVVRDICVHTPDAVETGLLDPDLIIWVADATPHSEEWDHVIRRNPVTAPGRFVTPSEVATAIDYARAHGLS